MSWFQGISGWFESSFGMCGYEPARKKPQMFVKAPGELFEREVPGLAEDVLEELRQSGGSLEEKLQRVLDLFRSTARRQEGLQQVLTRTALDNHKKSGAKPLPDAICQVISEGTYTDAILNEFDGQVFPLHSLEVAPYHEYRLALEIHSGGKYWSSISMQDNKNVRHKVEIVGGSSATEGSASVVSQFGSAQRGAVYVWRWQHVPDRGPYDLPQWLNKALEVEGNDPLRKVATEIEVVSRWVQKMRQETSVYVRKAPELKDPYIREVLRLWPSDVDMHLQEQLKKCAWVEGLDPHLFVGKTVLIDRVRYDDYHTYSLYATIAKRHAEEAPQEGDPPYRLTTAWKWMAAGPSATRKNAADGSPPVFKEFTDEEDSAEVLSVAEQQDPRPGPLDAAQVPNPGSQADQDELPLPTSPEKPGLVQEAD